jgi:hypothetical protein
MIALPLQVPIAGTGRLLNLPLCQATSWVLLVPSLHSPGGVAIAPCPFCDTIRVFLSQELSISLVHTSTSLRRFTRLLLYWSGIIPHLACTLSLAR